MGRLAMVCLLIISAVCDGVACSGPISSEWFEAPKLISTKTDFMYVIRVTKKIKEGESFLYVFDVIRSFKKPFAVKKKEIKIKSRTHGGKSNFPLELESDCEVRGELEIGKYYLHLPERHNHTLALSGLEDKILKDLNELYPR